MFVIVTTYRAKDGEEDAIIALHEDWHHGRKRSDTDGEYHSWKLLRNVDTQHDFISIEQFADEEVAQAAVQELKNDEWYRRLVSLMAEEPTQVYYTLVWQLD